MAKNITLVTKQGTDKNTIEKVKGVLTSNDWVVWDSMDLIGTVETDYVKDPYEEEDISFNEIIYKVEKVAEEATFLRNNRVDEDAFYPEGESESLTISL